MKFTLMAALFLFMVINQSQAQFDGLMRKVEKEAKKSLNKRMDKEVEKKVDEAVNKHVDQLLEEANDSLQDTSDVVEEPGQKRFQGLMNSMGVGVNVPHEKQYVFSAFVEMIIDHTGSDGLKESPIEYDTYFNGDNTDYAIRFKDDNNNTSYVINDTQNKCSLILTESSGKKSGIATAIKETENDPAPDFEVDDDWDLIKTGRVKTISGYHCEEYMQEDEDVKVAMWLSKDLGNKFNRSIYQNSVFGSVFWMAGKTDQMIVQYDLKSKRDQEHTMMTVTRVSFNTNTTIPVEDYDIVGINISE